MVNELYKLYKLYKWAIRILNYLLNQEMMTTSVPMYIKL